MLTALLLDKLGFHLSFLFWRLDRLFGRAFLDFFDVEYFASLLNQFALLSLAHELFWVLAVV